MKPLSRLIFGLMLSTAALVYAFGYAFAQSYPSKPITIITPYGVGGPNDLLSRIVGQNLTESWGQPVVVLNRGGGNTLIGTELAAKAPADGYTLFMGQPASMMIVPALYKYGSSKVLPYDTMKDFTPVAFVGIGPLLLGVHPSVPAKSVKELIALAKKIPGKLNYNSSGSGGTTHLSMEMLKNFAKVDIVHVPYKGGALQIIGIVSGEVDLGFVGIASALPHVKAGKFRALAISTSSRSAALPDLPTVAEGGVPGFGVDPWFGMVAPTGTPAEIVNKLSAEINKFLVDPKVTQQITRMGVDVIRKTPEGFREFTVQQTALWDTVVKASGAKVD